VSSEYIKEIRSRFWQKVNVRDHNECWNWTGARNDRGRGIMWLDRRNCYAPRIAWMLEHGEWPPDGKSVCHSCDNPSCVNPAHLWIGTAKENMEDSGRKGRTKNSNKTHCPKGHPYSGDNVIWRKEGKRRCKACQKEWQRNARIAKSQKAKMECRP